MQPARRNVLLAGAVGLASAAGGYAWNRRRTAREPAAAAGDVGAAQALWSARFPTPDGGELALGALRGRPLLVNFWATWCAPCVAEMPRIDRYARAAAPRGWHVVGLAVDRVEAVRAFLAKSPVGYAIGIAGFEGAGLARTLGNVQGGLPYSVALDAAGKVVWRKAGEASVDELQLLLGGR